VYAILVYGEFYLRISELALGVTSQPNVLLQVVAAEFKASKRNEYDPEKVIAFGEKKDSEQNREHSNNPLKQEPLTSVPPTHIVAFAHIGAVKPDVNRTLHRRLTSELSGPRETRTARRRRDNGPRACGAPA
jgi:hypothetical protein